MLFRSVAGATEVGREGVDVALELGMPKGERLGEIEPGRADRGRVEVGGGKHATGDWCLPEEDGMHLRRGVDDGARRCHGDQQLPYKSSDANASLRSGWNDGPRPARQEVRPP